MKCASGIQPSPHNSPIYDWAKLLSMRRIKSPRRGVRGKIRGGATGRDASANCRPGLASLGPTSRVSERRARRERRRAARRDARASASPFSRRFFSSRARPGHAEKLNMVLAARRSRGAHVALPSPVVGPIALADTPRPGGSAIGAERDAQRRAIRAGRL